MSSVFFKELSLPELSNSILLLDIDGTLLPDSASGLDPESALMLRRLVGQGNNIYLCSNGFMHKRERNRKIAQDFGITFHETHHKKPFKASIPSHILNEQKQIVIIGDRFLSDGLLAVNLQLPFIQVRSLRSPVDHLHTKISYMIDKIGKLFLSGFISIKEYNH